MYSPLLSKCNLWGTHHIMWQTPLLLLQGLKTMSNWLRSSCWLLRNYQLNVYVCFLIKSHKFQLLSFPNVLICCFSVLYYSKLNIFACFVKSTVQKPIWWHLLGPWNIFLFFLDNDSRESQEGHCTESGWLDLTWTQAAAARKPAPTRDTGSTSWATWWSICHVLRGRILYFLFSPTSGPLKPQVITCHKRKLLVGTNHVLTDFSTGDYDIRSKFHAKMETPCQGPECESGEISDLIDWHRLPLALLFKRKFTKIKLWKTSYSHSYPEVHLSRQIFLVLFVQVLRNLYTVCIASPFYWGISPSEVWQCVLRIIGD